MGVFLVFRASAGTITVQDAFGVMTDQPLVMSRTTTGPFSLTAAATGQVGDGKIFIQTLDSAVRIRTLERDVEAVPPASTAGA